MNEHKYVYQVIVVDDGSADKTAEVLKQWSTRMPMEIITHTLNRGLGETARDAFERAAAITDKQDIIIRLDADNTHEPFYIPQMIEKINNGFDVVIASRFQPGGKMIGVNFYRAFISYCANLILKLFFPIKGIKEYSCGFRAYRAGAVQAAIKIFGNNFIDLKGMGFTGTVEKLIKFRMLGAKITEIPFILRYDQKKSPSKMVTSITTFGYLTLIIKYVYPWGDISKGWRKKISEYKKNRE